MRSLCFAPLSRTAEFSGDAGFWRFAAFAGDPGRRRDRGLRRDRPNHRSNRVRRTARFRLGQSADLRQKPVLIARWAGRSLRAAGANG
jgi:hypothetical protein